MCPSFFIIIIIMVELFQKKRDVKHFPLMNFIRNKKKPVSPIITTSITRNNDPYMPHIPQHSYSSPCLPQPARRSVNLSTPHLVTHHKRQSVSLEAQHIHHHHHYYFNSPPNSPIMDQSYPPTVDQFNHQSYPPLSPPPLSPTTLTKPSWRNIKHSPKWQPALSMTSSEDDDDNEPLGLQISKPFSLLSDASEDGDDELIPIARLSNSTTRHLSAAEKYKAKVKAQLQMEDHVSII